MTIYDRKKYTYTHTHTHTPIREGNNNPLQYSCLGILWTEEPGGLQSMGSKRVRQNWATAHAHTHTHTHTHTINYYSASVQFSSAAQLCPTLCEPMNLSTSGLPVHNQLPEFTQTHVLSQWCYPTISSSVIPFSSCSQSFPASGSFPVNQLFTSGGQSVGVLASTSVLPMNTQDWSPLGWTGWISLQSKRLSRVFSNTTVQKHWLFCAQLSL